MEREITNIVFIHWGRDFTESNREIVLKKDMDIVFNDIKSKIPNSGWISINDTFVTFDKRIANGKCIKYYSNNSMVY